MLNHPTLDRLNELGLFGMAKAFSELMTSGDAATLPLAEGLGLLLDRESSYRNDKRLASKLRYAKLRHQAAVEERYGRRSTIVTSQPPVDRWHDLIGDHTYADAILDRLIHNAHRIELAGESIRKTRSRAAKKD